MKPRFKEPGTKRLKLTYDELLSKFAFNFNLRRYIAEHRRIIALQAESEQQLRRRGSGVTTQPKSDNLDTPITPISQPGHANQPKHVHTNQPKLANLDTPINPNLALSGGSWRTPREPWSWPVPPRSCESS